MANTEQIRDINKLTVNAKQLAQLWLEECKSAGLNVLITETLRTKERQKYLYSLGRTVKGKVVTWTLNSNHLSGNAFDFVPLDKNGKVNWNDTKAFKQAGEIAIKLGAIWGGNWKKPDMPHIEYNGIIKLPSKPNIIQNKIKLQTAHIIEPLYLANIITDKNYWSNACLGINQIEGRILKALSIKILKAFDIEVRDIKDLTIVTLLFANNFISDIELWSAYMSDKKILNSSNLRALLTKVLLKIEEN